MAPSKVNGLENVIRKHEHNGEENPRSAPPAAASPEPSSWRFSYIWNPATVEALTFQLARGVRTVRANMLSKLLFSLCSKEKRFFIRRCTAENIAFWESTPAPTASVTMNQASANQHEPTLYPPNFRVHRLLRRCRDRRLCHFSFQVPKRGLRCFSAGFHASMLSQRLVHVCSMSRIPIYERSCSILAPFHNLHGSATEISWRR
jgi:hypothetical protein